MRQRLIVRLNSDPQGPVHWIRLDEQGRVQGHAETGTLARAAEAAAGRRVVALAPAVDVALHAARIPTQSRQRTLKAVPFALEDQLAEEIEDLHFATGQRNDAGELAVAVVSKANLEGWLDAAADAGLDIDQIYPEVLALPFAEDAWTVLVEGERCVVRTGPQSGYGGDADNVAVLLEWALDETAEERRPQRLLFYSAEGELMLDGAPLPVEERGFDNTTALLATSLDEKRAIGLRSGAYAPRRGLGANWRRWQLAAALLLAWVLLDTGAALLRQWQLDSQLAEVDAEMNTLYQKAFPNAGPLINPRQQIESRLRALRGEGGGTVGVLALLDAVGPVLVGSQDVQVSGLSYRNGSLAVELYAKNLQDIDRLQQRLSELPGVGVEVDSASAVGDRVQGRLQIRASS